MLGVFIFDGLIISYFFSIFHFNHDIFLIVLIVDIDFDTVFVGSWKHEFLGEHFFLAEVLVARAFQLFDSVSIPTISVMQYLRVFIVFSDDETLGETFPIITVLQNPTNESFSTIVNLLPRKGVCPFP